ncbi:hypothetical protein [Streptomyces sp. NPDC101776]|uniref:hypothetical protein n=1 Tax=Streptomyces sp. NPDC101776 TaxID=3366146 RepID=UPI003801C131
MSAGTTLTLISLIGRQLGRRAARSDGRYSLLPPGAGSYVLYAAANATSRSPPLWWAKGR